MFALTVHSAKREAGAVPNSSSSSINLNGTATGKSRNESSNRRSRPGSSWQNRNRTRVFPRRRYVGSYYRNPDGSNRNGYCYMILFEAIQDLRNDIDLETIAHNLGSFPPITEVLSIMMVLVEEDIFLPAVCQLNSRLLHVSKYSGVVLFSELVHRFLFSKAHIGGTRFPPEVVSRLVAAARCTENFQTNISNEIVHRELTSGDIQFLNAVYDANSTGTRKKMVIAEVLTNEEKNILCDERKDYEFIFKGSIATNGHPLAAIARRLAADGLVERCGYDANKKRKDKRTFVIDVGGNYYHHAKNQRFGIHTCGPCVNLTDSARHQDRKQAMERLLIDGKMERDVYNAYVYSTPYKGMNVRCDKMTQDCKVKAKYMICLHSSYDIPLINLLTAMDSHDVETCFVALHFTDSIWSSDTGMMEKIRANFCITDRNKPNAQIRFSFPADLANCYAHDFNTYTEILGQKVLVTPQGYPVHCETTNIKMNTVVVTMRRITMSVMKPMYNEMRLTSSVYTTNCDDVLVLRSLDYSIEWFQNSPRKTMKPIFMIVPKSAVMRLHGICVRMTDAAFNIQTLISQAVSFNFRFTVNGVNIKASDPMCIADLLNLVVAVYVDIYRVRFAKGRLVSALITAEQRKRDSVDQNVLYQFVKAGFIHAVNKFVDSDVTGVHGWLRNKTGAMISENILGREMVEFFCDYITTMTHDEFVKLTCRYKDDMDSQDLDNPYLESIEFDTETKDAHIKVIADHLQRQKVAVTLQQRGDVGVTIDYDTKMLESTSSQYSELSKAEKKASRQIVSRVLHTYTGKPTLPEWDRPTVKDAAESQRQCPHTQTVEVARDGNCLYETILKIFQLRMTVSEFRRMMSVIMPEKQSLKSAEVTTRADWCETDVVREVARMLKTSICTHFTIDGRTLCSRAYGYQGNDAAELLHIQIEIVGSAGSETAHARPCMPFSIRDNTVELMTQIAMRNAKNLSRYHSYGLMRIETTKLMRTRASYKLIDILSARPQLLVGDSVLDIGAAPGAMTLILQKIFASVESISLPPPDGIKYFPDVDGKYCTLDEIDATKEYDLVISDAADGVPSMQLTERLIEVATAVVKPGGNIIVKLSFCFEMTDTMTQFINLFEKHELFKPKYSKPWSTESYLICYNFDNPPELPHAKVNRDNEGFIRFLLEPSICKDSHVGSAQVYEDTLMMMTSMSCGAIENQTIRFTNGEQVRIFGILFKCTKDFVLSYSEVQSIRALEMTKNGQMIRIDRNVNTVAVESALGNFELTDQLRCVDEATTVPHYGCLTAKGIQRVQQVEVEELSFKTNILVLTDGINYVTVPHRKDKKSLFDQLTIEGIEPTPEMMEILSASRGHMIKVKQSLVATFNRKGYGTIASNTDGVFMVQPRRVTASTAKKIFWKKFSDKLLDAATAIAPDGIFDEITLQRFITHCEITPGVHEFEAKDGKVEVVTFGVTTKLVKNSLNICNKGNVSIFKDGVITDGTKINETKVTTFIPSAPQVVVTDGDGNKSLLQLPEKPKEKFVKEQRMVVNGEASIVVTVPDKKKSKPFKLMGLFAKRTDSKKDKRSQQPSRKPFQSQKKDDASTASNSTAETAISTVAPSESQVMEWDSAFDFPRGVVERRQPQPVNEEQQPQPVNEEDDKLSVITEEAASEIVEHREHDTLSLSSSSSKVSSGSGRSRFFSIFVDKRQKLMKLIILEKNQFFLNRGSEITDEQYFSNLVNQQPTRLSLDKLKALVKGKMVIYSPPNSGKSTFLRENSMTRFVADTDYVTTRTTADVYLTNIHSLIRCASVSVAAVYPRDVFEKFLRGRGCETEGAFDSMEEDAIFADYRYMISGERYLGQVCYDRLLCLHGFDVSRLDSYDQQLRPAAVKWKVLEHRSLFVTVLGTMKKANYDSLSTGAKTAISNEVPLEFGYIDAIKSVLLPADDRAIYCFNKLLETMNDYGVNNEKKYVVVFDAHPNCGLSLRDLHPTKDYSNVQIVFVPNQKFLFSDLQSIVNAYDTFRPETREPEAPLEPASFPALKLTHLNNYKDPPYVHTGSNVEFRNAAIEMRHVWKYAYSFNSIAMKNLYKVLKNDFRSTIAAAHASKQQCNIYILEQGKFLMPESEVYQSCFDGENFVDFPATRVLSERMRNRGLQFVLVAPSTKLMLNHKLYDAVEKLVVREEMPKITFINGVPGCGKTYEIMRSHDPKLDVVLTMTTAGADEMRKEAVKMGFFSTTNDAKSTYRTIHSYIINVKQGDSKANLRRLLVDEAVMSHFGAIVWAILIGNPKEVLMYGDFKQIPYIDREHMTEQRYSDPRRFMEPTENRLLTRRCPQDITFALSKEYEGIQTCSTQERSVKIVLGPVSPGSLPEEDDTLYMCLMRSDKSSLIKSGLLGRVKNSTVLTIHEAQGQTFKKVILFRTVEKPLAVFKSKGHGIVAVSRHTQSLKIYYPSISKDDDYSLYLATKAKDASFDQLLSVYSRNITAGYIMEEDAIPMVLLPRKPLIVEEEVKINFRNDYHVDLPLTQAVEVFEPLILTKPLRFQKHSKNKNFMLLQEWYDGVFPGLSVRLHDDHELLHNSDIHVGFTDTVVFDLMKIAPMKERVTTPLRPLLRTSIKPPLKQSMLTTLTTLLGRNFNAPEIANKVLNPLAVANALVENFCETYFAVDYKSLLMEYQRDIVDVNLNAVQDWIADQPTNVRTKLASDTHMAFEPYSTFDVFIKPDLKVDNTPSSMFKMHKGQTVSYNTKRINAIMSPMIRELMNRLRSLLKKKFMINCRMSPDELTEELNKRFDAVLLDLATKLEVDFSKFDKSQLIALILFEKMMYLKLGLSAYWAEVYYQSMRSSILRDKTNGVKTYLNFQRKSGHACTFLGNTLVLMASLAAVYDLSMSIGGIFAGDDSVLWFPKDTVVVDRSVALGDLFNLEAKLLQYRYPYFCSKFILVVEGHIHVVPDFAKLVTKLARKNILNLEHLEDYRISSLDIAKPLMNATIHDTVCEALKERYDTLVCSCEALNVYCTLISKPEYMQQLFVVDDQTKIARNVVKFKH